MQRESTKKPGTAKSSSAAQEVTLESASVWQKDHAKRPGITAPPPDWTRYVDSRLKQFCTR